MHVCVPAIAIHNSFVILACSSACRWKGNFSPRWGLPRCCNNYSLPCIVSVRLCQSGSSMSSLFCRCMSRWRGAPAGSVLGLALKQLQRSFPEIRQGLICTTGLFWNVKVTSRVQKPLMNTADQILLQNMQVRLLLKWMGALPASEIRIWLVARLKGVDTGF